MIALIISLLLSLGVISTPSDYHNASTEQQEIYKNNIFDEDLEGN